MSEWISVEDRLPRVGDEVDVCVKEDRYKYPHTTIAFLNNNDWRQWYQLPCGCNYVPHLKGKVTHWMERPARPDQLEVSDE